MSYLPCKPSHKQGQFGEKYMEERRRKLAASIEQLPDSNENLLRGTKEKQENNQEHENEINKNKRSEIKWLKCKTSKDPIYV